MTRERILVLKFAALGDVAQIFAPLKVIRQAHPDAEITVLTTAPYAALVAASGYADRVETDGRPEGLLGRVRLVRRLRRARYRRVYDLQTSAASTRLWWTLLPKPPEWSGVARFGSHPHRHPERDLMHNFDRLADQLRAAGVGPAYARGEAPPADLSFAAEAAERRARAGGAAGVPERFGLSGAYALVVPGASPSRPEKLWPVAGYAEIARRLAARGLTPVVLGGPDQARLAAEIRRAEPEAVDLCGARADQLDIAALARSARLVVGGDTGPMQVAALVGAPGLMLLDTRVSNPEHVGPRGRMEGLARRGLGGLSVEEVWSRLEAELARGDAGAAGSGTTAARPAQTTAP